MNIIELIERSANELRDDECWTLDRIPHSSGYVYVQNRRLHRVAYEAHYAEPIPEGVVVMHTCDNRACFNPEHLTLGTQAENLQDMYKKDRQPDSQNPINLELAQQLRADGLTLQEIADELGCSSSGVWRSLERGR